MSTVQGVLKQCRGQKSLPCWLGAPFRAVFSLLVPARAPIAFILALAVVAAGCGADKPQSAATQADFKRALAGSPAPLARLYAQPGALVSGGPDRFRRELRRLRGHPVVVNKWASWCGPCRFEFPFFQKQVVRRGKQVAFLAVNAEDSRDAAQKFLKDFPVPYPSFLDPDSDIAQLLGVPRNFPTTTFYDRGGVRVFTKPGGYASEAALADDIQEYAIAGARSGTRE
jgi:cytochrome c biogenesis protein CcmG, thiol:disulfide interchange protein DsbE